MALRSTECRPRPYPSQEFKAYLDTLDAASLNAALYLAAKLEISPSVIPRLVPLIDRERCEAVLEWEISELLKKLE
jgi:hypothetical protein